MKNLIAPEIMSSRVYPKQEDVRGPYYRDTTAILHTASFRRLKHKTQVFFAPTNDHICTRIEHVLHVASIASTICKGLGLDDELAWAIGLGHDLGHAPFGHVGETILNELYENHGGFIHELYSYRVVSRLAEHGKGLNLTYAVRDGIISHCGEVFEHHIHPDFVCKDLDTVTDRAGSPATWEGAVVRMADLIAYVGRDLEDALRLRVISPEVRLPVSVQKRLGTTNKAIINSLVLDIIASSDEEKGIGFSEGVFEALTELKDFNYRNIYKSPLLSDYHTYFARMLRAIQLYLEEILGRYGHDTLHYADEKNLLAVRFGDYVGKMRSFYLEEQADSGRIIRDYIAGMTDTYAMECIDEIMKPLHMEDQFTRFIMEGQGARG